MSIGNILTERLYQGSRLFWKNKMLFFMALSMMVWYVIFHFIPYYWNLIAFKEYSYKLGFLKSPWVGLKYFKMMFDDPEFFKILRNTLIISIQKILFAFPAPRVLALMLNEIFSNAFKKTFQTAIFIPYFISWVIYASILITLLSPYNGLLNVWIKKMGGDPIYFLARRDYFRPILVISEILKSSGYGTVIYLAALAGIDVQLYEAAVCDGANVFRRIWHITLPGILPTFSILFILRLGSLLRVGFEQIYVLYNPFVYEVADVFDTFVYRQGIVGARFSYSTALGIFNSLIGLILVFSSNKIVKKITKTGLW
jgi:putative aldouronate transport system permease protein